MMFVGYLSGIWWPFHSKVKGKWIEGGGWPIKEDGAGANWVMDT